MALVIQLDTHLLLMLQVHNDGVLHQRDLFAHDNGSTELDPLSSL